MNKIKHSSSIIKRRKRVRGKIHGTADRPRLTVTRTQQNIYLQVIDDDKCETLVASNNLHLKKTTGKALKGTKIEQSEAVALDLAKKLKTKKITRLAFDRGHYRYHGRVKKVAETLRQAGLEV